MTSRQPGPQAAYSPVHQNEAEQVDPPPAYEHPPQVFAPATGPAPGYNSQTLPEQSHQATERSIRMPEITDITCGGSSRGSVICKISSALIVVGLAILIACIADSYHKVNEGNVGIYYRHGALKDRVTDPGVHFLMPFRQLRDRSGCQRSQT